HHVEPCTLPEPAPVELHVVVATLRGRLGHIDGEPATRYSELLSFPGEDFDTPAALERIFVAATASAALPVLFAPVDLPGVGLCSDGGLVNNTPILAACGTDPEEALDA